VKSGGQKSENQRHIDKVGEKSENILTKRKRRKPLTFGNYQAFNFPSCEYTAIEKA